MPEPHPLPPHYLRPNEDAFRHVAEAYGDDNPLWCDPAYGDEDASGVARSRRRHSSGGDTLIGEDEVTAVAARTSATS